MMVLNCDQKVETVFCLTGLDRSVGMLQSLDTWLMEQLCINRVLYDDFVLNIIEVY
jgi:hypothetical protein